MTINKKRWLIAILAAAGLFVLGRISVSGPGAPMEQPGHEHAQAQLWTCSMHPQIKLPKPGKCPICFMDLIPLKAGGDADEGERRLAVSQAAGKLAEIETAPVERRIISAEIRMVGKVDYDETRISVITARFPGRLERLFVDYTGVPVKKGDHLVQIYSPELYAAQEELLQAAKAASGAGPAGASAMARTFQATLAASREKLAQWGISPGQIRAIEARGTARDRMTLFSPMAGIVVHKDALEGSYVGTGTRLYTIADLSKLWIKLDAYESDLPWIRYGQKVEIVTESYPGEKFHGRIGFIDPVLDPATRTVKVRVNVDNPGLRLKPDMFVTGVVFAAFSANGNVIDDYLVSKWICPMHPDEIKNGPGQCGICGMPLVKARSLGYAKASPNDQKPLVIPASAPLITGKRAVVYMVIAGKDKPTYEGREITLGPRAGDYYVVASGLKEGERVVTHGAFKIDAEMQIQAKPSMMSPADASTSSAPAAISIAFLKALAPVYDDYFAAQAALAKDDFKAAQAALERLKKAAHGVDMALLKGQAHMGWMSLLDRLDKALEHVMHVQDISGARKMFGTASSAIIDLDKNFGHLAPQEHYVAFCPMAFNNKGGSWIQPDTTLHNPFYGKAMLKCGAVKQTLAGKTE